MSHVPDVPSPQRMKPAPTHGTVLHPAARRLWAARALGTAVLALLARHAVGPPAFSLSWTGDLDAITAAAVQLAVLLAFVSVALAWTRSRHVRQVTSLTLALVVAPFILILPVDPLLAGTIIAWALYGFGRMLFDGEGGTMHGTTGVAAGADEGWLAVNGPAVRYLLLVSAVAGISIVGFGFEGDLPALMTCQAFGLVAIGTTARLLTARARRGDWTARFSLLLVALAVAALSMPRISVGLLVFGQVSALLSLARGTRFTREVIGGLYERPAALLTTSFVVLILVGTLLLSFPAASASGGSIGFVDALFTATSASCVTGLIVLDTGADFSFFGQAVILLLLQVGGLNMMVLSTFAALLLGRGLGLRGEQAVGNILDIETPRAARRLVAFIVLVTLTIEALGAVGMAVAYQRNGLDLLRAVWLGAFHSISAFCNAGFALRADSLTMFQEQPLPLLLIASLIVFGGLGFAVLGALWQWFRRDGFGQMAVQSRIVLAASLALVVLGALAFLVGERNGSLSHLGALDRIVNALFQSVTLRTAGFNSVSFDALQPVTVLWMLAFMFIGASPGSTGGGIKTTTAVVLFAAIPAFLRRRRQVVIGGRSISAGVVYQSMSIAVASVLVVLAGATLLMASQRAPFEELLFEAFSAFGTVGLSLGATPELDPFGKIVIVLLMLVGRVGPLAITLLLARDLPSRVRYPEARLMVG